MSLVKFNNRTRNAAPYFNNVFDSLFNEALKNDYQISKRPNVNIYEDDDQYKIELAAPGLKKEDFKIEVKKNSLSVWAEQQAEQSEATKKYSRKEFEYRSFARSFILPEDVNSEKISASYEQGILHVTIGKAENNNHTKEIVVS